MSTILFIADGFPPVAGAGIKRPLKFIKFLTRAGWRSLVLTPDNNRFLPLDESLVSEIPKGTTV